jgi:UDP-GlcNAc:undecaprenyl-phosphate GlcNAc-1-phosphate transferase
VVLHILLPAAASFALTLLAICALRPLAIAVDLVDRPGGRKTHFGDVPIVGGLAMLLGIVLGSGLLPPQAAPSTAFLPACSMLVTIGLVDDRFEISPWARLPVQVVAAMILMIGAGAAVTTLGNPLGTGTIEFSSVGSVVFTVAIVMAAINAFNMLDGLDGLAGANAIIAFVALAVVSGADSGAALSLVVAGSLAAFLIFNMPTRFSRRVRCFMGDSGSTLLGFCVAWLCIQVSQGVGREVAPVTTLWVVALPVYEVVWSTVRRLLRGTSPFRPDRKHFHHLLLAAGFGARGTFAILTTLALLLATFGVIAHLAGVSDTVSFALLAACGVAVVRLMYRAEILWRIVPNALKPIFSRPVEPLPAAAGRA